MTSIQERIFNVFVPIISSSRMNLTAMRAPVRTDSIRGLKKSLKNFPMQEVEIQGHKMITFSAPDLRSSLHVIYLHGGSYIWQGDFIHWGFIKKMLSALNCRVTYVDYPLAPEHTYIDTFAMLQEGYEKLIEEYPGDAFVLMGDSSGGGLALAFAENLLLEKQPVQPKELILLSPWLDLTMSNPEIHAVEKVDRMLHLGALRAAAKAYSGGSDLSNYLLSPINGETRGLGEISIFIGTHDILEPDCRKFRDQVNRSGGSIIFHEYRDMQHVWMLFPIPEARDAFREIVDQLSKY